VEEEMICPKCKTQNADNNHFCSTCGTKLNPKKVGELPQPNASSNELIMHTLRLIIMLIVVFVLKTILVALPFIKDLVIPNFNISTVNLVNIFSSLIIFVFLIVYAISLKDMWPRNLPSVPELGDVVSILVYLISLVIVYDSIKRILESLIIEGDPVTILQIVTLLIAVGLIVWAGLITYKYLPEWMERIRVSFSRPKND
jgi:hypothetical protein